MVDRRSSCVFWTLWFSWLKFVETEVYICSELMKGFVSVV